MNTPNLFLLLEHQLPDYYTSYKLILWFYLVFYLVISVWYMWKPGFQSAISVGALHILMVYTLPVSIYSF